MRQKNIINEKMSLSSYVGWMIRHARIAEGLSGCELAQRVYMSQQQISRYECGRTGFQLEMLFRLMDALNMDEFEMCSLFKMATKKHLNDSVKKNKFR